MPWIEAMEVLGEAEVFAYAVTFSEMEGRRFNWQTLRFEQVTTDA